MAESCCDLLRLAQRDHGYSAVYATCLQNSAEYGELKAVLEQAGLWQQKGLDQLEQAAWQLAL
ncbi:MAG: hypothetical protein IJ228_03705 [Succinivibrio sp.]|nr:hypothetical protein [Succinivibrio sp.]